MTAVYGFCLVAGRIYTLISFPQKGILTLKKTPSQPPSSFEAAFVVSLLWALPRPSNYPLLDSKYHQVRTIRFQLRAVGTYGYLQTKYRTGLSELRPGHQRREAHSSRLSSAPASARFRACGSENRRSR